MNCHLHINFLWFNLLIKLKFMIFLHINKLEAFKKFK